MREADLVQRLTKEIGVRAVVTDPADMAPLLEEPRGLFRGQASVLVYPGSVDDVSSVMRIAQEMGVPVVPQGGNTGLVGGQIPKGGDASILLNLSRMNRVRSVDAENNTLSVDAGVTLAAAQQAAESVNRLFPLSLASEGTCQIGGNLSTNAGGTAVLHYGNARDLVLGLEVVLPDGRIWDGMRALRKDNTGYDLKQLFLGSEGTLGVITGAVLKLFPAPRSKAVAFAAHADVASAVSLLHHMEAATGGATTSFELMPRIGIDFVTAHVPGARDPLAVPSPWYTLIECSSGETLDTFNPRFEQALTDALERGLIQDVAVAQSEQQAAAFWQLREALPDAQKPEGASIKHDVSVPVSRVAEFISEALAAVEAELPGIRPVPFGHIGDGNIHFNLSQPTGMETQAFLDQWGHFNAIVHGIVARLGGSISAEHGIGQLKRDEMANLKSDVEMDLMRSLKRTLDPNGLLNPGKVVDV